MTVTPSFSTRVSSDQKRVFLHVGAPKTGTSYIQSRFDANRAAAAERGLLWVMPWGKQVEAVRDLKSLGREDRLAPDGAWMRLVDQIRSWPGSSALLSMEWLMNARDHHISAAVSSLQPARVEVVCTARDLIRVLPATWQESTQNAHTWPWDEYLRGIVDPAGPQHPGAVQFLDNQNVPEVIRRWRAHLPAERVHLVTVPVASSGPEALWDRFCSVLGLPTDALAAPGRGNASLGVASARLLQRVNGAAQERQLSRRDYNRFIKHLVAKRVLPPRRPLEGAIAVPDQVQEWLSSRAEEMIAELRELSFHLVGDLDELVPQRLEGGCDPSHVSDAEMLDAAVEALAGLVEIIAARDKGPRPQQQKPPERAREASAQRSEERPRVALARRLVERFGSAAAPRR